MQKVRVNVLKTLRLFGGVDVAFVFEQGGVYFLAGGFEDVLNLGREFFCCRFGGLCFDGFDAIKNMAEKLPGTSDGVKIFLQPTKDALIGTKADLYHALSDIVTAHDIVTRTQFIPSPFPH